LFLIFSLVADFFLLAFGGLVGLVEELETVEHFVVFDCFSFLVRFLEGLSLLGTVGWTLFLTTLLWLLVFDGGVLLENVSTFKCVLVVGLK